MLDILQETLLYIEQQHDWLAYIQSVIAEKEQKYKLLHTKITCKISEELNKLEMTEANANIYVKQEYWDCDTEYSSNESFVRGTGTVNNVNSLQTFDNATSLNHQNDEHSKVNKSINHERIYESQNSIAINKPINFYDEVSSFEDDEHQKLLQSKITEELEEHELVECNTDEIYVIQESSDTNTINQHHVSDIFNKSVENIAVEEDYSLQGCSNATLSSHHKQEPPILQQMEPVSQKHNNKNTGLSFDKNSNSVVTSTNHKICSYCSKSFVQNFKFVAHLRIHTGEKPFKCIHCNKSFRLKSILAVHMRLHTGEKPYCCSYCNKTFTVKSRLTTHLRTHTGEKPYECLVCSKRFSQQGHLADHMQLHTGEKLHCCSYCNKTFKWKKSLRKHLRTHAGIAE